MLSRLNNSGKMIGLREAGGGEEGLNEGKGNLTSTNSNTNLPKKRQNRPPPHTPQPSNLPIVKHPSDVVQVVVDVNRVVYRVHSSKEPRPNKTVGHYTANPEQDRIAHD